MGDKDGACVFLKRENGMHSPAAQHVLSSAKGAKHVYKLEGVHPFLVRVWQECSSLS